MNLRVALIILVTLVTRPAHSQTSLSIPVSVTNDRTYITVRIGSVVIPDILLDTGFAFDGLMLFNPSYTDSIDMSGAFQVQVGGAGSGDDARAMMIDSATVTLGDRNLEGQAILILNSNPGFFSNGLVGYSIFGHFITCFDYDNNVMTLHEPGTMVPDESWETIPLYFKDNNIPWLDAAVATGEEKPVKLSMYIDYAAGDEIVLLEREGMKFPLPAVTEDYYIGRGLSGDIYGKRGPVSKVVIGSFEVRNVYASFADAEVRSKQDNADGVIGNRILRRFNQVFDYASRRLYLKPNSGYSGWGAREPSRDD